jgi:flavin-dependent dehydrogenase
MLLARRGHRVLLLDRATFPSDTLSTHVVQPRGVAALGRWGLLDAVAASGCPPVTRHTFDFGPFALSGTPRPVEGTSTAFAPRRTVLDKILVEAAVSAGAELRERFTVDDLLRDEAGGVLGIVGHGPGGDRVVERATVVIGADGRDSLVARTVRPSEYHAKPRLQYGYYSYWADLPVDGFEIFIRPNRGWGAVGTNDGLTMVVVGWPIAERDDVRSDIEGNYLATFGLVPGWADRVRSARRVERFTGGGVRNFFRVPHGPGWALVGDAGCTKDPITAQGISDAFRDAELCAAALDATFRGESGYDDAMAAYQAARDAASLPMYEFTTQLATLEPPAPELQGLLGALVGNQPATDDFVGVATGTVSPAEFFTPENVSRVMAAASRNGDLAVGARSA